MFYIIMYCIIVIYIVLFNIVMIIERTYNDAMALSKLSCARFVPLRALLEIKSFSPARTPAFGVIEDKRLYYEKGAEPDTSC